MCAKRWIKNKQKNNEDADGVSKKMDAMPQWFAFMLNSVVHMEQQETTFTLEKSEGLCDSVVWADFHNTSIIQSG